MKTISLIITASIILCGLTRASAQSNLSSAEKIVMHSISKQKNNGIGMQIPLPDTWSYNNDAVDGEPVITAPGGVEVYNYPHPQDFLYANDSVTVTYYHHATGIPVREPRGVEYVIETDLKPLVERNGYSFVGQYPLKDVAMNISSNTALFFNPLQLNNLVQVSGTEWAVKAGNKLLIVIQYTETGSLSDILSWGYSAHSLQAPLKEFESARDHFIYGLANLQYNPDDIKAYNDAQRAEWDRNKMENENRKRYDDYNHRYNPEDENKSYDTRQE